MHLRTSKPSATRSIAMNAGPVGLQPSPWCGRLAVWLCKVALASCATASFSTVAGAQADRIDAGSFSISQQGHRVGREQFSLRKVAATDGSAFELRSESVAGERRVAVQLTTDSVGSPIHYSLQIREGTRVTVRAGGQRTGNRFSTQALRDNGESAREYALIPGMLILEAEFYHQFAMAVRGRSMEIGKRIEVSTISLLENAERPMQLVLETRSDSVTIAGAAKEAFRWKLSDGTGLARTLWSDAEGRLLRIVVPSRSIEVTRDALPK